MSEVAAMLRVSRFTIYRLWERGKVRPTNSATGMSPENRLERFIKDLKD